MLLSLTLVLIPSFNTIIIDRIMIEIKKENHNISNTEIFWGYRSGKEMLQNESHDELYF